MIKKLLMILLVIISCVGVASASIPQFSVTELLEDKVINGENDFGDLLFLEQPYTAQNYIKGTITPLSLQQHDVMNWVGTQSIRVMNPQGQEMILHNESGYYNFDYSGIYTMTSMLNSSITSNITVSPEEQNNISVHAVSIPTGFDLDIPNSIFTLNQEEVVPMSLNVDDDVEFGEYEIVYSINGDEKTKQVEVLENINWSMNSTLINLSSNIKSGSGLYLGRIEVENTGNADVEIVVTKNGTGASLITTPQVQTLYRKNNIFIDIQAQIPTITLSNVYDITLNISGGNISKMIEMNITVQDNILPVIEKINFSTEYVGVNDISIIATDNTNVTNVTMSFENQVKNLVKDGNLFLGQYKFDKLSRYVIDFCAYDIDGNEACKQVNKTFDKITIIENASSSYTMPSMRFGKYSKVELFEITEMIAEGVSFTLIDSSTSLIGENSTQPIIRVIDSKGSIKQFPKYQGAVTIFEKGKVYLEVRGDQEMSVDGVIRVDVPEQYEGISDITFKTSFKNYDVPQPFSVAWVDGRDFVCKVKDTGNLDTSYYDCNIKYPVTVQSSDISVPTTVEEKNKFKAEAEDVRIELIDVKRKSAWFISILIASFTGLICFTLFMIYYYPYVRFKTGKKMVDKTGREL